MNENQKKVLIETYKTINLAQMLFMHPMHPVYEDLNDMLKRLEELLGI